MDARAQLDVVFLLPCFPLWGPFENARWTFPGIHQRMLDGHLLVSIRECSMDTSGPIPSSCVRDIHFSELRFVEADIDFLAGTPTIIRVAIAKQASKFPAAHTVVHFVLLLPSVGSIRMLDGPYSGVHQGML